MVPPWRRATLETDKYLSLPAPVVMILWAPRDPRMRRTQRAAEGITVGRGLSFCSPSALPVGGRYSRSGWRVLALEPTVLLRSCSFRSLDRGSAQARLTLRTLGDKRRDSASARRTRRRERGESDPALRAITRSTRCSRCRPEATSDPHHPHDRVRVFAAVELASRLATGWPVNPRV